MDTISCRHCKTPFVPNHANTRLCSDTCKIDRNKYLCKEWDRANKDKKKTYYVKKWAKNKDFYRDKAFKERYGITLNVAKSRLIGQDGVCAICKEHIDLDIPGLNAPDKGHMDHCHDTGKIRGILCRACNWMLGNGKDDPNRLLAGAKYLAGWKDAE